MSYVIIFLIVTIIAACLAKAFNKKIDMTIPISVMLIVLIIYPFGFFSRLDIGVYVIEGISTLCFIYLTYKFIGSAIHKKISDYFRNLLTPGLVVYVLLYIIFIFINKNRLLSNWDEFSHWGLVVKNMFSFDAYGTTIDATMNYKGYPPFTAIFEYFTQKVVNSYDEGRIVVSMNLLYISMILPVFRNVEWKKGLSKLLIYIPLVLGIPMCMYENFYTSIYVDAMLGVFMAYIIYMYFSQTEGVLKNVGICLGMVALPLIKTTGAGLAIFALAIILIDTIVKYKKDTKNKKIFHKKLLWVLVFLICFIIGKFSWDIHLAVTNTAEAWNTDNASLSNIISLVTGNGADYQYTTIKNFIKQFFTVSLNFGMTSITNFAILLLFILYCIYTIYLVYRKKDETYKQYIIADIALIVCYIIYMISLLILYLFTFSEYEALKLASYERYSYIPFVGMYLFNTLLICDNLLEIKKDKINYVILFVILLIILPLNRIFDLLFRNEVSIKQALNIRSAYSNIQEYKSILNQDDMIYYISCGSSGYDFNVSNYEFIPIKMASSVGYSLGPKRNETDLKSKDISLEKFEAELRKKGYTYVYIFKADNIFKEKYYKLFEDVTKIEDKTLYKIKKSKDHIKLIEIE